MDSGTLPIARIHVPARLVSDLLWAHPGRPCIIVGGGPSTPDQLAQIKGDKPWMFIAANGHAFRLNLRPDYVFCKDDISTETKRPMEPTVRRPGIPVIGRHFWTDYRVAEWPITGNSGQHAIAIAALMGCAPIVPIGFDGYQNGTYWYDRTTTNVSLGRHVGHWESRFKTLAAKLKGAVVRTVGGPATKAWARYSPTEIVPIPTLPVLLEKYQSMPAYRVHTRGRGAKVVALHIPLPANETVLVSDIERRTLERMNLLDASPAV